MLNIPVTARLFGLVNNEVLADAVRDVIRRHAILRTIFPERNGIIRQEIMDNTAAPALSVREVDTWSMTQVINEATDYPFDLTRETPMRAHLFSAGQGEHTLLFVFHRIAFDSRSVAPLMRDLFAFYSARIENRESDLPPMSIQYADYAWMQSMGEELPLFSDIAIDDEDIEARGIVPVRINPGMHNKLCTFAKGAGVSVDSVLHTGLAIMYSWLGFDIGGRVAVSTVEYAGYCNANTKKLCGECGIKNHQPMLIGNFETILSFEVNIQGNPTFRETVNRAAELLTADSMSKYFRTLFRLKPVGIETLSLPMLKVFVKPVPITERGFDLIFDLSERLSPDGKPQGIEGNVFFNSNAFPAGHMPIRLDWMMTLLKHGIENPDVTIDRLTAEEKPVTWSRLALTSGCSAATPESVQITRVAIVRDNGRQEKIPLNPISSAIDAAPGWQQSYVAFQDALQCRLVGIWEETLKLSRIGVRDRFADLGGDTGKARQVIETINKVFSKNLPELLMCGGATIEALAGAIFSELPLEPFCTIQTKRPDSKPPLFFVHGDVFGGGFYTIELARHLGEDMPFFSFNPYGLDGQAIPESIEEMAKAYLEILKNIHPSGSFYLGGYCSGALVAYEMARIIEREGRRIESPLLLVEAPAGNISETQSVDGRESKRPSPAPQGLQMRKTWVLNELFRLSDRYRPGQYTRPVAAIHPETSLSDEVLVRSVWKKAANNIRFLKTPGDHITCIGRHAPELAGILRDVMNNALIG